MDVLQSAETRNPDFYSENPRLDECDENPVARLRFSDLIHMGSKTDQSHFLSRHSKLISLLSHSMMFRYYENHQQNYTATLL
jgi:hypothetical protein